MTPDHLLAHFDRLAEAPDAVPRLRRFILDLAVRGKLVEQDPNDEPTSELLKRIQAEKERPKKEGYARTRPLLPPVGDDEPPFELPIAWCWVRLIDVLMKLTDGTHHSPPNHAEGEFKYVTAKNIKPEGVSLSEITYISAEVHRGIYARCDPEPGDVLYIKDGATTGVVTINDLHEPFSMLSSVALLKLHDGVYNRLLVQFLRSPFFYGQMRSFMKGAAITRVTLKRMAPALIPLPPLAEQHRIVAKVDELMALCDRLTAAQAERERRRDGLAAASLHRLNHGADAHAFRAHARFHLHHLPRLTTGPEHIQQLRQTILDLAVRGQLVSQDPNDEPAAQLLKRTQGEKLRLIQEGNVKKQNWAPPALSRNSLLGVPSSWTWSHLQDVVAIVTVGHVGPMANRYVTEGIPFLRSQNVRPNRFDPLGLQFIDQRFHRELRKSRLTAGDVVVVRSGNVGVACVIPASIGEANCADLVIVKQPLGAISQFLSIYINSITQSRIQRGKVGIALSHFNTKSVAFLPTPIPPLAEQHRIVAKVDELMALCDRLEAQLSISETESRRLLEAVLHEALLEKDGQDGEVGRDAETGRAPDSRETSSVGEW